MRRNVVFFLFMALVLVLSLGCQKSKVRQAAKNNVAESTVTYDSLLTFQKDSHLVLVHGDNEPKLIEDDIPLSIVIKLRSLDDYKLLLKGCVIASKTIDSMWVATPWVYLADDLLLTSTDSVTRVWDCLGVTGDSLKNVKLWVKEFDRAAFNKMEKEFSKLDEKSRQKEKAKYFLRWYPFILSKNAKHTLLLKTDIPSSGAWFEKNCKTEKSISPLPQKRWADPPVFKLDGKPIKTMEGTSFYYLKVNFEQAQRILSGQSKVTLSCFPAKTIPTTLKGMLNWDEKP